MFIRQDGQQDLVLNVSAITFEDVEVDVGYFPYSDARLAELRETYASSHYFRRENADQIVGVPTGTGAAVIGAPGKIRLKAHLRLSAGLVRDSLIRYLRKIDRTVLSYEPLRFIARTNLLTAKPLAGIIYPEWLSVRPLQVASIRPFYFFGQKPFIGVALDVQTTRVIEQSCDVLMQAGIALEGLYVGRRIAGTDPRIAPHFKLKGRVERVEGDELILSDTGDNDGRLRLADAWLEKSAFDTCLNTVFGKNADAVRTALEKQRRDLRYGPTRLGRLKKIVEFFRVAKHELIPDLPFTFEPLLSTSATSFPKIEAAPKPTYVFDPTGRKTSTWHDGGLNQHGPYTSTTFTPTAPRICIICQAARKGDVERFIGTLLNGVTGVQKYNYFEKGFLRKYALKQVQPEFFTTADSLPKSYRRACEQAMEQHARGQKWDLALIQIEESFHRLPPAQNPYFVAKVPFLTQQIPVQQFEIETALSSGSQLSAVLNNMALAMYAKLNGIPWLLKANPTIAHELVIGLGSAYVGDGRLGDRERYIGITTVFSGDGNYHLSTVSKAVTMPDYQSALLESLRTAITKVKTDYNWQPREQVRLVFHAAFKSYSKEEVGSVKALMKELGDYDVEYAFLEVSEDHPFVLFDTNQAGKFDYESRGTKGVYAPERGQFIQLSNREILLCLTGSKEVKRPEDGIPKPVLLKLHRESSFQDITYLTRQAFVFACHSWRTFLPAPLPVTIQYSDLIARALGNLEKLPEWSPQVMWGRIGRTYPSEQPHVDKSDCGFYRFFPAQAAGVRPASRWIEVSASPGKTAARYSRIGIPIRRQLSTTDKMAATFGPACRLPTWIQFFRPSATGRIEFSARLLLSSSSGCSRKRVSRGHRVSVYFAALPSALAGSATARAVSIS